MPVVASDGWRRVNSVGNESQCGPLPEVGLSVILIGVSSPARVMSSCTIVIPCFNETARLDLRAFVEHAARHDHRFLFVDDGSTDGTGDLLDDFCCSWPDMLSVLHLPRNAGKAEAVRQGVLQACRQSSTFIGYWDADLATPLSAIPAMEGYLREHPHVAWLLGSRVRLLGKQIERKLLRHVLGRVFATAASNVLRMPVYDTQCGAKLFRNESTVAETFSSPFLTRWIFDVELLARLLESDEHRAVDTPPMCDRIHEFPLNAWRDVAGSKLKPTDFLKAAWQLGTIYRHYPALRKKRETNDLRAADRPRQQLKLTQPSAKPSSHEPRRIASHPSTR